MTNRKYLAPEMAINLLLLNLSANCLKCSGLPTLQQTQGKQGRHIKENRVRELENTKQRNGQRSPCEQLKLVGCAP